MKQNADLYASDVVLALVGSHGLAKGSAISLVQKSERLVRQGHEARVAPGFVAGRIMRQSAVEARRHRIGHASGSLVERRYGWNLDSLRAQAMRRAMGGGSGHAGGGEAPVKASNLVCVSDGWMPAAFVPANAPERVKLDIDPKLRELFKTARGARDPKDLQYVREKIEKSAAKGKAPTEKQLADVAKFSARAARILDAQDKVAIVMSVPNSVVTTNKSGTTWMSGGAMSVQFSGNEKIQGRQVSTTYASIEHTCPVSCAQRGVACYAETSNNIAPIVQMLTHVANVLKHGPEDVAEDEARAIDASFAEGIDEPTDLRIHTVGDSRSKRSVRTVASAAHRWLKRSTWMTHFSKKREVAPAAWSYTHAWYEHSREDWGPVSTLASIQTAAQLKPAFSRGWALSIVVPPDFFTKRLSFDPVTGEPIGFMLEGDATGTIFLPCPAQNPDEAKAVGCTNCRLCLDDRDLFKERLGIAFRAHAGGNVQGMPLKHPMFDKEYTQAKDLVQLRRKQ